MDRIVRPLIVLLAALFAGALGAGCATSPVTAGTSTDLKEKVVVGYIHDAGVSTTDPQAFVLPVIGDVADFALKLGAKIAAKLIRSEAAKYEQSYAASTGFQNPDIEAKFPIASGPSTMKQGGYWVMIRTVNAEPERGLVGLAAADIINDIAGQLHAAGGGTGAASEVLRKSVEGIVSRAVHGDAGQAHTCLTFAAYGTIQPLAPRGDTFQITFRSHKYAHLKAKSIGKSSVLRNWSGIDSRLAILLEGPSSMPAALGGEFAENVVFPVPFKEESAGKWSELSQAAGSRFRSQPIHVPATQTFYFTAKVSETSSFKKVLESIATEIEKFAE